MNRDRYCAVYCVFRRSRPCCVKIDAGLWDKCRAVSGLVCCVAGCGLRVAGIEGWGGG